MRVRAAGALGRTGDPAALSSLLAAVTDDEPDVRAASAAAIGALHLAEGGPALGRLLRDADPLVRTAAIGALAELGAAAAPVLLDALGDNDPALRWLAVHALEAIGSRIGLHHAVPVLAAALRDPYSAVRWMAAEALASELKVDMYAAASVAMTRPRTPAPSRPDLTNNGYTASGSQ